MAKTRNKLYNIIYLQPAPHLSPESDCPVIDGKKYLSFPINAAVRKKHIRLIISKLRQQKGIRFYKIEPMSKFIERMDKYFEENKNDPQINPQQCQ
jgi:hypothetical protein